MANVYMNWHNLSREDFDKLNGVVEHYAPTLYMAEYWSKKTGLESIGISITCFTDDPPIKVQVIDQAIERLEQNAEALAEVAKEMTTS